MESANEKRQSWSLITGIVLSVLALTAGPALAALTFSGTSISGNGAVLIDSYSTISIGTSTATGITIGKPGSTTTFPGNLSVQGATMLQSSFNQSGGLTLLASTTINGNATTTGNLTVLGSLLDAGGNKYVTSTVSTSQWITTSTDILLDPANVITGATFTFGNGIYTRGFYQNENAIAGTAVIGTLPVAAANEWYCLGNDYNGSDANTGMLTVQTSGSGQYLINTDGSLSASGGYISTDGNSGDLVCVIGIDATHWRVTNCSNENCTLH